MVGLLRLIKGGEIQDGQKMCKQFIQVLVTIFLVFTSEIVCASVKKVA
jgi:hypothetical protein